MNKIHLIPIAVTGTSCFAEIQNGEFAINLTDKDKKENFEKTFNNLKEGLSFIISSPEEGITKNNDVYFRIEKDKIVLCDIYDNNNDKYFFYSNYIKNYVTLKEKVYGSYNLMHNKHEINDIKTCEIEFNIPEDYISKYEHLAEKINILKEKLFNNKDYGFLIFNDVYSKNIKEHHRSFNIELKNEKFIITANKDYVEKSDSLVRNEYCIKVFIDPDKKEDYVINDKYKDYNLEKVEVSTYSLGNKKGANNLIEDFKKYRYCFNIEGYKLCDNKGKEITGNKLEAGTYYVKNDRFFTKKTIIELYDKFLKEFNDNLVNGVEELINKDSISEEDFKNKMTAINEFFKRFSDKKKKKNKTYEDLFKDVNYGKYIDNKFDYLNILRRKLMAMYLYKNAIIEVNSIMDKLQKGDVSGLNIDDFFDNSYIVRDYACNFIYGIYGKLKKEFIKFFSVNGCWYYNDVTKQDYNEYEYKCVEYEIEYLLGHREYDKYEDLQKNLKKLIEENKGNLFANVYTIKADTTNLKESNEETLRDLVSEINGITKKVLYRKEGVQLYYESLLSNLDLYAAFYEKYKRILFFDIFVDDKKVVFDYTKNLKDLLDTEVLPEGKHTILLKFYDCIEAYDEYGNKLKNDDGYFTKLPIAQIYKKDYEEKEIEKINNIKSLTELKKNYKEILEDKDKHDFYRKMNFLHGFDIDFKYKHSEDKDCIGFYTLPNIYKAVATKLLQLEKEEMAENERKGVEEIENKYKGLVDIIIKEINSTETLEKLKELPYSKKEDIKNYLEGKVKSEVNDYDNKKSKINDFDIFVNNYVEQVYNAYNTKSSAIIKEEEEKKIKAAAEEEDKKKKKKEEEDKKKKKKEEEDKVQTSTEDITAQTSTEVDNKQQTNNKKPYCNCKKK